MRENCSFLSVKHNEVSIQNVQSINLVVVLQTWDSAYDFSFNCLKEAEESSNWDWKCKRERSGPVRLTRGTALSHDHAAFRWEPGCDLGDWGPRQFNVAAKGSTPSIRLRALFAGKKGRALWNHSAVSQAVIRVSTDLRKGKGRTSLLNAD